MTHEIAFRCSKDGARLNVYEHFGPDAKCVGYIEMERLREAIAAKDAQFRKVSRQSGQVVAWIQERQELIDQQLSKLHGYIGRLSEMHDTLVDFQVICDSAKRAVQADMRALDDPLVLLSKRIIRLLEEAGIERFDQLAALSEEEISAINGIGQKAREDLRLLLAYHRQREEER